MKGRCTISLQVHNKTHTHNTTLWAVTVFLFVPCKAENEECLKLMKILKPKSSDIWRNKNCWLMKRSCYYVDTLAGPHCIFFLMHVKCTRAMWLGNCRWRALRRRRGVHNGLVITSGAVSYLMARRTFARVFAPVFCVQSKDNWM